MSNNNRSSHWSVTINNPTEEDRINITEAHQKGWKVIGQEEVGENGTPHLQLMVTTGQVRFSAVKKIFPRAHIEPARNVAALRQYVEKEETRVARLPTEARNPLYPTVEELYRRYLEWLWQPDIYEEDEEPIFPNPYAYINHMYNNHDKFDDYVLQGAFEYIKKPTNEQRLSKWKSFLETQIEAGNHVDQLATNPQVLSFVKTYTNSMLIRALKQIWDLHDADD